MNLHHFTTDGRPVTVSKWLNWRLEQHCTLVEAENAFQMMQEATTAAFVGLALHLIQQCGGELYHRGVRVAALRMQDTSGDPVKPDTLLLYGTLHTPFDQLD